MKKKFYLICIGSALLLTSCGGETSSVSQVSNSMDYYSGGLMAETAMWDGAYSADYDYDYEPTSTTSSHKSEQVNVEQKLIRRVHIDLELESNIDLESNAAKIQGLATAAGGYTADISLDNRSSWANGNISLKIPKDNVDSFLTEVKNLGIKVTSISDSSEDVTMKYVDTATRLEVKETSLMKYKQYLEQAANVEELLSIESRIDGIVADIESYEAQLRVMDNQINYTEVTVNINCKTSINRDSFWVRAGQRIKSIGYEIGDNLLDGIEWMLNAIIAVGCAAIPGIFAIRVIMFAFHWKRKFHPVQWVKGKLKKKEKEDAE